MILLKQKLGQSNITSLVERVSRFTVLLKNLSKRTKPVMGKIMKAVRDLPHLVRKSIIFDRGDRVRQLEALHRAFQRDLLANVSKIHKSVICAVVKVVFAEKVHAGCRSSRNAPSASRTPVYCVRLRLLDVAQCCSCRLLPPRTMGAEFTSVARRCRQAHAQPGDKLGDWHAAHADSDQGEEGWRWQAV